DDHPPKEWLIADAAEVERIQDRRLLAGERLDLRARGCEDLTVGRSRTKRLERREQRVAEHSVDVEADQALLCLLERLACRQRDVLRACAIVGLAVAYAHSDLNRHALEGWRVSDLAEPANANGRVARAPAGVTAIQDDRGMRGTCRDAIEQQR